MIAFPEPSQRKFFAQPRGCTMRAATSDSTHEPEPAISGLHPSPSKASGLEGLNQHSMSKPSKRSPENAKMPTLYYMMQVTGCGYADCLAGLLELLTFSVMHLDRA